MKLLLWQSLLSNCSLQNAESRPQTDDTPAPPKDLVELGVFGPPHGTRGEIRLMAITDSLEERLEQPGTRQACRHKSVQVVHLFAKSFGFTNAPDTA